MKAKQCKAELEINAQISKDLARAKVIFVLGGPGSGKGTHCARISKEFGFMHLSTGDLLRDEVKKGGKRAQNITSIMNKGELVPNDIVLALLKDVMLANLSKVKGFLLDGYPRSMDQVKDFEREITKPFMVRHLDVRDEELLARMTERGKTSGRSDDNPETMKKRLVTFHEISRPVIDYYSKQRRVQRIDGSGSAEETYKLIRAKFK